MPPRSERKGKYPGIATAAEVARAVTLLTLINLYVQSAFARQTEGDPDAGTGTGIETDAGAGKSDDGSASAIVPAPIGHGTAAQGQIAAPAKKTVVLEWENVAGADSYEIKLTPAMGGPPIFYSAREPHLTESLAVGVYELRIRSRGKDQDEFSPWSPPAALEVLIKEVKPLSPENHALIEAEGRLTAEVEFSWTPIEKVKEYKITIWTSDIKDKPFSFVSKASKKRLTVKTGREYFWNVSFESANDISYAQMPPVFSFTLMGQKLITPAELKTTVDKDERIAEWIPTEDAQEYKARLLFRHLDESEYRVVSEATTKNGKWALGHLRAGAYRLEVTAHSTHRLPSDKAEHEFSIKPSAADLAKIEAFN